MKKHKFLYILGLFFICASMALLLVNHKKSEEMQAKTEHITAQIQQLIPNRQPAIPEQYSKMNMPVCEVEGSDYCALLCVQKLGIDLPVANIWGDVQITPTRYSGSVYDDIMIIGGSEQHLGFVTQLDLGDKITVVDMLGGEFNYTVSKIDRANAIDEEKLDSEHPLIIFTYKAKEKKYIIVRCE